MGLLTVAGRLLRVVCCLSFNLCRVLMVVRVVFCLLLLVVAMAVVVVVMMTMMLMMAWFVSFGWLFDLILVVVVMAGALLVLTVMIVMAMMVSVMLVPLCDGSGLLQRVCPRYDWKSGCVAFL